MKAPSFKKLKELAAQGGTHKIGDLTIEFFYKRDAKRLDSFWFHDSDICRVEYKDRVVFGSVQGDMCVQFKEDDDTTLLAGHHAVEYAIENNLTDKHLNKIGSHDGWTNNNWIELYVTLNLDKINLKEKALFFSNKMDKFISLSKTLKQRDRGREPLNKGKWISDLILDTYDEAIENAVHCALDDEAWKNEYYEKLIENL